MGGTLGDVPELVDGELRIERFVVEAKLGEGGMADVWLCRMTGARGFSRQVVIKTIKPSCRNEHYESMFIDEATIGARLEHPNIPRVIELSQTAAGDLFMVQEYVEGPSVQQIIAAQRAMGKFDLRLAVKIATNVASALDFAYRLHDEHGEPLEVVHRDVSTTNILVSRRGPAKLIDFGVAKFSDRGTRTATGVLKGKLRFMAPELVSGGRPSHRSDLYSLGQVLYRLCVGERPEGVIGSPDWIPPSEAQPDVDPALDAIIVACLQPNPDNRIPSGDMLAQRLERWAFAHGGPITDAESAARIAALFPSGANEWQPTKADPRVRPSLTPKPRPRAAVVPAARMRVRQATLAAVLSVALLGAASMGTVIFFMHGDTGEPRSADDIEVKALIESARTALHEHRLADAEQLWMRSTKIPTRSQALRSAREDLTREIRLMRRVREVRELATSQPEEALMQAQHLWRDYPNRPDVAALVAELKP